MKVCLLHQGDPRLAQSSPLVASALHTKDAIASVLRGRGAECVEVLLDDRLGFIGTLHAAHPDLVFNACDLGLSYRPELEPHVSAILDAMRIPYTGSDAFSLSLTNDKALSKELLSLHGVPTPRFAVLGQNARKPGPRDLPVAPPVICKPLLKHNSLDISFDSVVYDPPTLASRIQDIERGGQPYLLEEYIEGRELIAAFVGNDAHRKLLPIEEILFGDYFNGKPHVLTYAAKWDDDDPACIESRPCVPAAIGATVERELARVVPEIARVMHMRDYGRVDFRLDLDGRLYAIDINANPDVSPDAGLFKMARAAGLSYADFIWGIIDSACQRGLTA